MKKYEMTKDATILDGIKFYRIRALIDIPFHGVKKGDLGGFIEEEKNLSHEGSCWVGGDARVFYNSSVSGNAIVCDNAKVFNSSVVFDEANIHGHATISAFSKIFENAEIYEYARIQGSKVYGNASVSGATWVLELSSISGNATLTDLVYVCGTSIINGYVTLSGNTIIRGGAKIHNKEDYIVFKSNKYYAEEITWTRSNNMWAVGEFHGKGSKLLKIVYNNSNLFDVEYERVVAYIKSVSKNKQQTI